MDAFTSHETLAAQDPSTIGTVSWMIYHYSFPDNEINDWLVTNHQDRYEGDVPDLFTECGFTSAQAIVAALTATEGDTFPENMIPALEGLQWSGPKGEYYIQPGDHLALVPMYIAELVAGDDPDFLYYNLLETVPATSIIPPCTLEGEFEERCEMNTEYVEGLMGE